MEGNREEKGLYIIAAQTTHWLIIESYVLTLSSACIMSLLIYYYR